MPYKPKQPCKHPGCNVLVPYGQKYCERHKAMHPEEIRSASARGYGNRWQKVSRQFLFAHPFCAECMKNGRYVKATVVDHITPHRGNQELFWDMSNWRALCKKCHDRKTALYDSNPTYHY